MKVSTIQHAHTLSHTHWHTHTHTHTHTCTQNKDAQPQPTPLCSCVKWARVLSHGNTPLSQRRRRRGRDTAVEEWGRIKNGSGKGREENVERERKKAAPCSAHWWLESARLLQRRVQVHCGPSFGPVRPSRCDLINPMHIGSPMLFRIHTATVLTLGVYMAEP